MIAIVDYGMGNLRSVSKALEYLGRRPEVTRDPAVIARAERVILPGVGAFGAAMDNLRKFGLVEVIQDVASSGKPLLGICLGMQLLLDESAEKGQHSGLGIIPGRVIRFVKDISNNLDTHQLKIPHMGWNSIELRNPSPLLEQVADGSMVYFVHSYYACPPTDAVAATTSHGTDFCSVITRGNVFATQFHPEKSGAVGLQMLRNFAEGA